tara:strand:+ start:8833 stop:9294 length:462 start_codon:yes stop_codon:yes gene_type:complete
MINTRIAYTQEDGSVAIVMPTPEFCACPDSDVYKLAQKSMPLGTHFEVLDVADIPTDRYFRNAWRLGAPLSKSIDIDRPHAERIHLDCLRKVRNQKLEELDLPFQFALESKDIMMQNNIASKKQALRDMPQNCNMDLLDTTDKIKAFVPDILQ